MKKMLIAAAVVALVVAVSSATAARTAAVDCGKLTAGGKTWHVVAARVSCKNARTVVRTLAPKPAQRFVYYPGKYFGMACIGAVAHGRRAIQCSGTRGQTLVASTKA